MTRSIQLWSRTGLRRFPPLCVLLLGAALTGAAFGDTIEVEVTGIGGLEADNIRAFVGSIWVPAAVLRSERRRSRFLEDARLRAEAALRPFGWYFAIVRVELGSTGEGGTLVDVYVEPGPPLIIDGVSLQFQGEGEEFPELLAWKERWSLRKGDRLVQPTWEQLKNEALDITEEWGFLGAAFVDSRIELNLKDNTADLFLVLDTGTRSVMGNVTFDQDQVLDIVLQPQPRFTRGSPYRAWYVDRLRTDLWTTGYFENISVEEIRRADESPPMVDLRVAADPRNPTTHQATVGYGTDSEFRLQYRWTWHRISERGDSLAVAGGYQKRDDEYLVSTEYRLPRRNNTKQFWFANGTVKSERARFEITDTSREDPILNASGRIDDYALRLGRGRFRDLTFSRERLLESMFVEFLHEGGDFTISQPGVQLPDLAIGEEFNRGLSETQDNLTVGMDWSWPLVTGSHFKTTGYNGRAWLMHSNEGWGSDLTFSQAYLGSRWAILLADRWKLLLRGEAGYSDAEVIRREFELGEDPVNVSITRLPYLYRFRAGGSRSVRGYGFETLSDSGLGANNLLTASVEAEYNFHSDWSAAIFYDIGNAFNSWSDMNLKRGVGVGLRWYTVAGPIRVDYASALDRKGDPWSIHITIGTPLL